MDLKIRQKNGLNATRDQVHDVMTDVDLKDLRQRQSRFERKSKNVHLLQLDQTGLYL